MSQLRMMKYEEFRRRVLHHFDYLWKEFGFVTVKELPDLGYDSYLLKAQADACFFEFLVERGWPQVLVGTNRNVADETVHDEFDVITIIYFLSPETRPKDWFQSGLELKDLSSDERIELVLPELSGRVRPYSSSIIHLFQPDTYREMRPKLKAFDDLRQRLLLQGKG